MQYLLYYVVCNRVQGTTKEVFMGNIVDTTLANHGVFMQQHAHDAKVSLAWYMKANGIPSPFGSDTFSPYLIIVLIRVLFWCSRFKVVIYLWGNHMFPILAPYFRLGLFWTWAFIAHFYNTCQPFFLFKAFYFHFAPYCVNS